MPFTPAHPAAALPLGRLHRRLDPLALVVGSVMPDLPYMILVGPVREVTHTFAATLWFCLPTGILAYLMVRVFFLEAWHAVLPSALRRRIERPARGRRALSGIDPVGVLGALWLGALTHAAWDAFTHWTSPVVQAWPALQGTVAAVGNQRLSVFNLLQHGSTVIGLMILLIWVSEWYQGRAPRRAPDRGAAGRRALLGLWLVAPAALATGAMLLRFRTHGLSLLGFTTGATAAGFTLLPAFCFTALAVGFLRVVLIADGEQRERSSDPGRPAD